MKDLLAGKIIIILILILSLLFFLPDGRALGVRVSVTTSVADVCLET